MKHTQSSAFFVGDSEFWRLLAFQIDRWKLSIPDIVNIIEAIVPRLFRIDQNVVDSCLFQGQNIVREINTEGICFLV